MNKTLSAEYCLENTLVILSSKDDLVQIGHLDEIEREKADRLERYFLPEQRIEYIKIKQDEFDVLITRLLSGTRTDFSKNESIKQDDITNAANAAPVVNLLNSIISEGIMKCVSDIHIEINELETRIRCRKDGKLEDMLSVERDKGIALTGRIKILSDLNILEHRKCQDGRFEFNRNNSTYDIRVSIIPGIDGESTVLRLLGGDIKAPQLEQLGFTDVQLEQIKRMIETEHGLFRVTGPTGSGKTTTLASILSRINNDSIEVITVEDPVEYRLDGVLQINVDEEIGQTFSEILKRLLRHDPDVLMVGEIRDEETAAMACRMALTGHLVFASVHTTSCEETPIRLVDMGVKPYIVSAVLKGVISQKLIEKEGGGRTVKADILYFENEKEVRKLCGSLS